MMPRMPSSWSCATVAGAPEVAVAYVFTSGWSNWLKKVNIDNRRLAEITAVQGASLTGRRQAARSGPATISPGRQPRCPPRGRWGDLPTGAIAQHLRRAGVAERPQLLQGRFTVIGKRPNRIESALRPWPKGPDQGNREIADPAAEEGKQRERVLIGPVKVIEQQQGR